MQRRGSGPVEVVVFDLDGTLVDSAPGIVSGFAAALAAVGRPVPDDAVLRADLGPPVDRMLRGFGVTERRLAEAVETYREHYRSDGFARSSVYPGIVAALGRLGGRCRLATATAKRIPTAEQLLAHHGLLERFEVVGGSTDRVHEKAEILATALTALGDPDRSTVIMVGDRASDLTAARTCGVRSVGVTWGYGSRQELEAAHPDHLIDHPLRADGIRPEPIDGALTLPPPEP